MEAPLALPGEMPLSAIEIDRFSIVFDEIITFLCLFRSRFDVDWATSDRGIFYARHSLDEPTNWQAIPRRTTRDSEKTAQLTASVTTWGDGGPR